MAVNEKELRVLMCEVGRRLYAKNLAAATDGNLSVRLAEDRFLCTPSGSALGYMRAHEMIIADAQGHKLAGEGKVSSEFFTHLAAYEERAEIGAVVHAHPPRAVALSLAGQSLMSPILPEVVFSVGGVPTASYATPGTREGADAVRPLVRECDALLMDRHGALTVGESLLDALYKMEKIEHAAEILLAAAQFGDVSELSGEQIDKIMKAREAYGARGKVYGLPEDVST